MPSSEFWGDKNAFRILADFTHLLSKIILIVTIHLLRSAEGISLLTQLLYLIVFLFRYIDLFWTFTHSSYNTTFKIFYITSSIYTLWLMLAKYKRSREGEREWKVAGWSLIGSLVVGTIGFFVFERPYRISLLLWNISIVLESLHLLPQISLLSHVSISTAITSYYLVALGSYRFLYILNWIVRFAKTRYFDPMPFVFGVIQTLVYAEFAWVYWRRQRIKLRTGEGVIDEEDFIKGWGCLRLIYGRGGAVDRLPGGVTGGDWREWSRARWNQVTGRGGLSVSADEERPERSVNNAAGKKKAKRRDLGRDVEEGRGLVGADEEDGEEEERGKITLGSDEDSDDGLARD